MSDIHTLGYQEIIARAYAEDLGDAGDISTLATIPAEAVSLAHINSREAGIACGLELAKRCFHYVDSDLQIEMLAQDGDQVNPEQALIRIEGASRSILTAERVALNFAGRLSGIASLTAKYVAATEGTKAHICCTRKTTPGLRRLEKYAVRCGGGMNHRFGLYDAVMIKDNHIAACGSIGAAIDRARAYAGHMIKIEVEIDRLEDLEEALQHNPDVIMLDNMSPSELAEGVGIIGNSAQIEASGSVSLELVAEIAATGVDLISVGKLTHSAPNFDLGLDFKD